MNELRGICAKCAITIGIEKKPYEPYLYPCGTRYLKDYEQCPISHYEPRGGYVLIKGNSNIFCSNKQSLECEIKRALNNGQIDLRIQDSESWTIEQDKKNPKPVSFEHKGYVIKRIDTDNVYFIAIKEGQPPIKAPTYTAAISHINLREWNNGRHKD